MPNAQCPMPELRVLHFRAVADNTVGLGRREVLQRLAAGVGGVLAAPFFDEVLVGAAQAKARATAPKYRPESLDAQQVETIASIAERIVPGSTQANSAPFIDQLLTVATADDQRKFLQALGTFEELAIDRHRASWTKLSEQQQIEVLTFASAGGGSARGAFDTLKGWSVGAYYSSEIGMRELGWTGRVFYPELPGCDHPGGHAE